MVCQLGPTCPLVLIVLLRTWFRLELPSKPPVTTTNACVSPDGTATAAIPVSGPGRGVPVETQVTLLIFTLAVRASASVMELLVPALVVTLTSTSPGTVNECVPSPGGTFTPMLVFVQAVDFGVTVAVIPVEDCVKTTEPGELWKPLPLIWMRTLTGLEGSVALLILLMEGVADGAGVPVPLLFAPPQPGRKIIAVSSMSPAVRNVNRARPAALRKPATRCESLSHRSCIETPSHAPVATDARLT